MKFSMNIHLDLFASLCSDLIDRVQNILKDLFVCGRPMSIFARFSYYPRYYLKYELELSFCCLYGENSRTPQKENSRRKYFHCLYSNNSTVVGHRIEKLYEKTFFLPE